MIIIYTIMRIVILKKYILITKQIIYFYLILDSLSVHNLSILFII